MATAERRGRMVLFRMKSDEFCNLPPSDLWKLELLDGEVLMAARPTFHHQYFISELVVVLKHWVKKKRLGWVTLDTLMTLSDEWTPAPDLCFIRTKHLPRVKKRRIEGPVDLAVEVVSPSGRRVDRETKFNAYAEFGIPWYWIVELEKRTLAECKLVDGAYSDVVEVSFDEPFKPRLFKGLKIDLASLEW